jgi:hypothetical protein
MDMPVERFVVCWDMLLQEHAADATGGGGVGLLLHVLHCYMFLLLFKVSSIFFRSVSMLLRDRL